MSSDNDTAMWNEYRRLQQKHAEDRLAKMISVVGEKPAIDFCTRVTVDEYGTATLGEWGGYLIQLLPMIFNDRIVMTPKNSPYTYDYGWCFDKGGAAVLAVLVWDPATQAEPVGYKKRATGQRQAGETAATDPADSIGLQTALARWGTLLTDTEQ